MSLPVIVGPRDRVTMAVATAGLVAVWKALHAVERRSTPRATGFPRSD